MTSPKTKEEWASLLNEHGVLTKKLQSKREALKILVENVEQIQVERDIFKNKAAHMQQQVDQLKDMMGGLYQNDNIENKDYTKETGNEKSKKYQTLTRLLNFSREEGESLRTDLKNIKQLYKETQKDNQLLRDTLTRHEAQRRGSVEENEGKVKLIGQLEEAQQNVEQLRQELEITLEEKSEIEGERDLLKEKNVRLNKELNYVLHNDDRRIVDVDSLSLENSYLKEVVKQYKEEKSLALSSAARYKDALNHSSSSKGGHTAQSSAKQDSQQNRFNPEVALSKLSAATSSQLQAVNHALTEKLSEKEITLKHQRNTNRVLGTRVAELEKKLKTLEISGLWTMQGTRLPPNSTDYTPLDDCAQQYAFFNPSPPCESALILSPTPVLDTAPPPRNQTSVSAFENDVVGRSNTEVEAVFKPMGVAGTGDILERASDNDNDDGHVKLDVNGNQLAKDEEGLSNRCEPVAESFSDDIDSDCPS